MLRVRESPVRGVFVEGLVEVVVTCAHDVQILVDKGPNNPNSALTTPPFPPPSPWVLELVIINLSNLLHTSSSS